MRALTIRQPWATLIARGEKTIETRSWRTSYRGEVAIHAGLATWPEGISDPLGPYRVRHLRKRARGGRVLVDRHELVDWQTGGWQELPLGVVVAVADLVDVVPMIEDPLEEPEGRFVWVDPDFVQVHDDLEDPVPFYSELERELGDFAEGRWAWLLENVRPLDYPAPAKGRQGLWTPDHDLAFELEVALR